MSLNVQLKMAILEQFGKQRSFARQIPMLECQLSKIINGHILPDYVTARRICGLLALDHNEVFPGI